MVKVLGLVCDIERSKFTHAPEKITPETRAPQKQKGGWIYTMNPVLHTVLGAVNL